MLESAVVFVTEAGMIGLFLYFWRLLRREDLVMGPRFEEMKEERNFWRDRALGIEEERPESLEQDVLPPPPEEQ